MSEQPDWSSDIEALEAYFSGIALPTQPTRLNGYSTIIDCTLFVEGHLATVKSKNGNHIFSPYLDRLKALRNVLEDMGTASGKLF
jgi:hypothetical protein